MGWVDPWAGLGWVWVDEMDPRTTLTLTLTPYYSDTTTLGFVYSTF